MQDEKAGVVGAAQAAWQGEGADDLAGWLAATYACQGRRADRRRRERRDEPFALLHRSVD